MKEFIKKFYKNSFVYSTKEKLSKLSILLIIVLNIIVFNIIIEGLNFQTHFVNSPSNKYPYFCTNIIKNENISDFDSFSNSAYYIDSNNLYYAEDILKNKNDLDSRCIEIEKRVAIIKNEHNLKNIKEQIVNLNEQIYKLEDEVNYFRNNYNTVLFEKIANHDNDKSILNDNINSENIKAKYNDSLKNIEKLKLEKENIYINFENSNSIKSIKEYINTIKENYIIDEEKAFRYYYYIIEIIKMLFLLPLVFVFFFLMKKCLVDEKYILYIIFKNLFVVSLIPTLYTVFQIIYKFLPKVFLSKVIEFFYNLDIPFLVYYILVIIFVLIFVVVIIKIQKRFREQNELMKRNKISKIESYNKNLCNSCGNSVSYIRMNFCPVCQNMLKIKCKSCQNETIFGLNYCQNCSEKL